MQKLLAAAACLAASTALAGPPPVIVLDNARVRVWKVTTAPAVFGHPDAVFVAIQDDAKRKAGDAYWSRVPERRGAERGGDVRHRRTQELAVRACADATRGRSGGGEARLHGMSFVPLFENDRVTVIRGRMDVGAQEGFHTHGSDIVVVHLSGGAIEDTADGKTKVNRWKHGDVEFEGRGSSHSARNLGPAVDAVLVTLKP